MNCNQSKNPYKIQFMIQENQQNSQEEKDKKPLNIFILGLKKQSKKSKAQSQPYIMFQKMVITSKNVCFFGINSFDISLFTSLYQSVFQQTTLQLLQTQQLFIYINKIELKFLFVFYMSESQQNSSFCTECHKERGMTGKNELNHLLSPNMHNYKVKDLKDAQNKFHKLQKQIVQLKQQNQKKIQTIETLKVQMVPKSRKSSVQIQMQQNRKSFQQLKNSLISFGNNQLTNDPHQIKPQRKGDSVTSGKGSISTQLIINSLQKRLKQYKIQLIKLIQKVELHQKSTEWMYSFIDSFLKMVLQINKSGRYGQPLDLKELSIKKRTKIAWKYLKDILEKILNQ